MVDDELLGGGVRDGQPRGHVVLQARGGVREVGSRGRKALQGRTARDPGVELPVRAHGPSRQSCRRAPLGRGGVQGRGGSPSLVEDRDAAALLLGAEHQQVPRPKHPTGNGGHEPAQVDLVAHGGPHEGQAGIGGDLVVGDPRGDAEEVVHGADHPVHIGGVEEVHRPVLTLAHRGEIAWIPGIRFPVRRGIEGVEAAEGTRGNPGVTCHSGQVEGTLGTGGVGVVPAHAHPHGHGQHPPVPVQGDAAALLDGQGQIEIGGLARDPGGGALGQVVHVDRAQGPVRHVGPDARHGKGIPVGPGPVDAGLVGDDGAVAGGGVQRHGGPGTCEIGRGGRND